MSIGGRLLRPVVLIHRWVGIFLCLLMTAWFASGIIMMYTSFPLFPASESRAMAAPIDPAMIRVSPGELIRHHSLAPAAIRLYTIDGRPRYALQIDARERCFFADTGDACPAVDTVSAAERIAAYSQWPVTSVSEPFEHDQWTVYGAFDAGRPYRRIRIDDGKGTDYYLSVATAEIVQRTTQSERFWNTLGSVIHWIYPTVIRKNWALWDQLVWWLSLAGIVVVTLGLILGVARTVRARRAQRLSLFSGWMKWHHLTGLVAGTFVLTWIISGWLSMDHGRLFSTPDAPPERLARFHGIDSMDAALEFRAEHFSGLPVFHSARFSGLSGEAIMTTQSVTGTKHWRTDRNAMREYRATDSTLAGAVGKAWPAAKLVSVGAVPDNDVYTQLREGALGPQVLRVELATPEQLWVHVDRDSLQIINVMDDSRRAYRWWYNGLHSLDFPGLVNRRPLWDVVMLTLLLAGLIVCASSVVIGVRRLRQ